MSTLPKLTPNETPNFLASNHLLARAKEAKLAGKEVVILMGGSFAPISKAHVQVAEELQARIGAAKVIFIPNYVSPLKDRDPSKFRMDPIAKLEIVQKVVADHNKVAGLSDWEVESYEVDEGVRIEASNRLNNGNDDPSSFTIKTLKHFYESQKFTKEKHFVVWPVGSDAVLDRWRDPEGIAALVEFAVIPRPDYTIKSEKVPGLENRVIDLTPTNISSTAITAKIEAGEEIGSLVPAIVIEDITNAILDYKEVKEEASKIKMQKIDRYAI